MTIYPAEIFGVAEQLGSIEKGKIANIVVTERRPVRPPDAGQTCLR